MLCIAHYCNLRIYLHTRDMGAVRTQYLAPSYPSATALDNRISRYEYVYWSAQMHVWICICIPWRGHITVSRSVVCTHTHV